MPSPISPVAVELSHFLSCFLGQDQTQAPDRKSQPEERTNGFSTSHTPPIEGKRRWFLTVSMPSGKKTYFTSVSQSGIGCLTKVKKRIPCDKPKASMTNSTTVGTWLLTLQGWWGKHPQLVSTLPSLSLLQNRRPFECHRLPTLTQLLSILLKTYESSSFDLQIHKTRRKESPSC